MRHIRLPKILSFRNIAVFFFVANFLVFWHIQSLKRLPVAFTIGTP